MQVSVESISDLEKRLKIDIAEEAIAAKVQDKLQSMTKTTRIKGFRQGKVPLKIVQKQYGEQVRQEVMGQVMQDSLSEAIQQQQLQLATSPQLENFDPQQQEGITFTAKVEVLPDFTIAPLEKLTIEKPLCTISDDDVNKMIETICKQHRKAEVVERAAIKGDMVVIDFTGRVDGETFENGTGTGVNLELGSGKFIMGFEDGLIGVRAGESKLLKLKFPHKNVNEKLAGKNVEFQVGVKTVNKLVLPDINKELFNTLDLKVENLEGFKSEVRKNMELESEHIISNKLREAVMEQLYQSNKIDLPPSLLAAGIEQLNKQITASLQQQGAGQDPGNGDTPALDSAVLNERARRKLSLQLLFVDIVKSNGIKAEPSKVRTMIEKVAAGYQDPAAMIRWYYSDKTRLAEVEALVLEEAVIAWIMQKVQISEIPYTFDMLVNKRHS